MRCFRAELGAKNAFTPTSFPPEWRLCRGWLALCFPSWLLKTLLPCSLTDNLSRRIFAVLDFKNDIVLSFNSKALTEAERIVLSWTHLQMWKTTVSVHCAWNMVMTVLTWASSHAPFCSSPFKQCYRLGIVGRLDGYWALLCPVEYWKRAFPSVL